MPAPPLILRDGALDAVTFVIAGDGEFADAVAALPAGSGEQTVLVWDATGPFGDSIDGVHAALDGAWDFLRPDAPHDGAKIVLLAPRPGTAHAEAARAGLENLARTLSIEWSRFGTRIVTILPGAGTTPDEVAQFVAYLASRAGDYFSGTALTLS